MHKKTVRSLFISLLSVAIILFAQSVGLAVTHGELVARLFAELGYQPAGELQLPLGVPVTHPYAKELGSAARYGLIPKTDFDPDEELNRHEAVRLTLQMMGWGFEVSLYESLATLPDLGGSGDTVFFLAAEMKPQAPAGLLVDGLTPLSGTGRDALLSWARNCKRSVQWNRVVSYNGVDLILYRQGVARPGEPNTPGTGNPVGIPNGDPLYVAALAIHPDQADQRIAFAEPLGFGRVTLSDFSSSYEAIGGINGGFFSGNRPLGTMLLDGMHAGKPLAGRSAIGWDNEGGTFVFGKGEARVGVRTPGGFVEFTRYNVAPQNNEASLYNPGVTHAAVGTALDALLLVVKNGTVADRREGNMNNPWIPEDSMMIVARGNSRALLEQYQIGNRIDVVTDWSTPSFRNCRDLIQAGPMLLQNGQFVVGAEGFKSDVLDKRHPRTIVGTDGKRVIWAVIDGRSAVHSRGTTMEETRWVARSLGLTTALNMDGGGSSQLLWRGVLANSPSDGKERPLPYAILMMPKGASMVRRNIYEQGEFGEYGYTTESEKEAVYMDTYDPLQEEITRND